MEDKYKNNFNNNKDQKSDVEFYVVRKAPHERIIIAAIPTDDGGYVYFGINYNHSTGKKMKKLEIKPVDNIIELCGASNVKVLSIDRSSEASTNLYNILLKALDDYAKNYISEQKSQKPKKEENEEKEAKPFLM